MRFILPAGALTSLKFLRFQYQEKRSVDIDKEPSIIGLPTFFGGTDLLARSKQIKFLEKMKVVLQANLVKEEDIKTNEQKEAMVTASRVMIAACLYIQSQISTPKRNSALYNLINFNLGITDLNYLDEEDQENCLLAANRIINSSLSAYSEANAALRKANLKPFTEKEWSEFSKYLSDTQIKKVSVNPYTNYPVTSVTQPLFGAAFSYTGATIGYLSGDVISQSSKAMSTKYQITTAVGGTLLALGTTGPMGVALFSQVIAGKLITAFFSISLAHVLGTAMGLLGQGVGVGIGMPLDMAYRLLWKSCSLIGGYYSNYPNTSEITGIRISDGMLMINGLAIDMVPPENVSKEFADKTLEYHEGKLYLDGKVITVPDSGLQLPPEVIKELQSQLKLEMEAHAAETAHEGTELKEVLSM